MKFQVNFALLPMKIFYFCYMAAIPSLILYVSPLFQQLGLTTDQIGITGCAAAIIGFVSRSLFGALVDKYQCFRQVLIVSSLTSSLSFCLLLLLPKQPIFDMSAIPIHNDTLILCSPFSITGKCSQMSMTNYSDCAFSDSALNRCWPNQIKNCSMDSDSFELLAYSPFSSNCLSYKISTSINRTKLNLSACKSLTLSKSKEFCLLKNENKMKSTNEKTFPPPSNFWFAFILRIIAYFFFSPGLCLMDAVTFQIVADKPEKFGFTRSFGSIGFLVFSLITGFAMYYATTGSITYTPSFFLYSGLMIVTSLVAAIMPEPMEVHTVSIFKSMHLYCFSAKFLVFYGVCFALGMCMSVLEHYVFMAIGTMFTTAPPYFFGLMSAVMVLTETPVFQVSGYVIKKIGAPACLIISLLTWALRFFSYSFVKSYWPVLGIEITHGVAFGLMMCSMSTYASQIAPKGAEATVQGIAQGISFGLGPAVGSLIGGLLYRRLGIPLFFRVCGCFAVACSLLYGVVYCIVVRSAESGDPVADKSEQQKMNGDYQLSDVCIKQSPDGADEKLMNGFAKSDHVEEKVNNIQA